MKNTYPHRLMSRKEMRLALSRIAAEVIEDHPRLSEALLIGILRRGVPLSKRLKKEIEKISGEQLALGILDITFYRDDLSLIDTQPVVEGSSLDFEVNGRDVLLIDDVLYTGRTTRAALDSLLDYGRPRRIELAVLVDRGHRELPIHPDYVGKVVDTEENEVVEVRIPPVDDEEGVFLTTRALL